MIQPTTEVDHHFALISIKIRVNIAWLSLFACLYCFLIEPIRPTLVAASILKIDAWCVFDVTTFDKHAAHTMGTTSLYFNGVRFEIVEILCRAV